MGYEEERQSPCVTSVYKSYPGLEERDYITPTSLEMLEFDTEFDLENPDHRVMPIVKYAEGVFSFSISLTLEALKEKEDKSFIGLWTDANLVVGVGIILIQCLLGGTILGSSPFALLIYIRDH